MYKTPPEKNKSFFLSLLNKVLITALLRRFGLFCPNLVLTLSQPFAYRLAQLFFNRINDLLCSVPTVLTLQELSIYARMRKLYIFIPY